MTRAILLVVAVAPLACQPAMPPANGEGAYRHYCASCHGPTGRGDGPAAGALVPPPTDLTSYHSNVLDLMQVIDGRHAVRAHGSSAMPVWGEVFEQMHLDDAHAKRAALLQVEALADYVARLGGGGGVRNR